MASPPLTHRWSCFSRLFEAARNAKKDQRIRRQQLADPGSVFA